MEEQSLMHSVIMNKDLVSLIYSFLPHKESAQARRVCRAFFKTLPLVWNLKFDDLSASGEYHDVTKRYLILPSFPGPAKELRFSLNWKDQGWGNQKGSLEARLYRKLEINSKYDLVLGTDLFGIASHEEKSQEVVLSYPSSELLQQWKKGDQIEIWRHVGGGGGHMLFVTDFKAEVEFFPFNFTLSSDENSTSLTFHPPPH